MSAKPCKLGHTARYSAKQVVADSIEVLLS
jgi:hypothetical protein